MVLLRIVEGQAALRIFENLGKRAKMKLRTRQGIAGAQEEGSVVLTLGQVQKLSSRLSRLLKGSPILIQLIQTVQHRREVGGSPNYRHNSSARR